MGPQIRRDEDFRTPTVRSFCAPMHWCTVQGTYKSLAENAEVRIGRYIKCGRPTCIIDSTY